MDMSGINLFFFVVLAVTLFFFAVAVFQWLWNITMPEAFGLKPIRYWVAFRLILIASFLTSGPIARFHGVG